MGLQLGPEIWTAIAAATGLGGWLVGELRGAARARVLIDEAALANGEKESLFTLKVAPKVTTRTKNARTINARSAAEHGAQYGAQRTALRRSDDHPPKHDRRAVFVDMPPVDELRVQARTIRNASPIWNAPDVAEHLDQFLRNADAKSVGVLNHYRDSIEELQHTAHYAEAARERSYEPVRDPVATATGSLNDPLARFRNMTRAREDGLPDDCSSEVEQRTHLPSVNPRQIG